MITRLSATAAVFILASVCSAQSYSCGGATAPGSPLLTQYKCYLPNASFSQTGTWTTYCYAEPLFGD
jgi:hypothetical protein